MSAKSKRIKAELDARAKAKAQTSAPIVRATIDRMGVNVNVSADQPATESIVGKAEAIRKLTDKMIARLPMWMRVPCPSWYTRRGIDKTGKAISVRDITNWEKEITASLNYVANGLAPIVVANGREQYDIPMPVTVSLMAAYVDAGNVNGVLTSVEALMRKVRSTPKDTWYEKDSTRAFADALIDQLAASDLDAGYAPIVRSGEALVKAQTAYNRAADRASLAMGTSDYESLLKRRDSAATRLSLAQTAFDRAWAERHMIKAPVKAVESATPTADPVIVAIADGEAPADPSKDAATILEVSA